MVSALKSEFPRQCFWEHPVLPFSILDFCDFEKEKKNDIDVDIDKGRMWRRQLLHVIFVLFEGAQKLEIRHLGGEES